MTRKLHRAPESIFRKWQFSQELSNFSLNFRETNQTNQSEGFPVLQEEQLERQRRHINVNKNRLKSTKTRLNVFDEWRGQPYVEQENLKTSGLEVSTSSYIINTKEDCIGCPIREQLD